MQRLSQHLDSATEDPMEWVGIFLQGSQNYNLDYEGSDIDSKMIVLPRFEDFALNRKPLSYTHIMENNEHVDVKDIRLMFECFRKQNINFVEVLFTKYRIINPKYEALFYPVLEAREKIARYNDFAALNCMVGTALEKQKALCHPYPGTMDKIERFGYDPKQLHHILRLKEFMGRWLIGTPYEQCLRSEQADVLRKIKVEGVGPVENAVEMANKAVQEMKSVKENYFLTHHPNIDGDVDVTLNLVLINLLKYSFTYEIGGELSV